MRKLPLFVGAALLLAGCTTTVTGSPRPVTATSSSPSAQAEPVRHVDPAHVTSADALGDITTVDPCSLIKFSGLPSRFGAAHSFAAENIDDCELYTPNNGTTLVATVGILEDYATATTNGVKDFLPRSGGMRIAVLNDDSLGCDELLVFADNVTMSAAVWPATAGKATGMCDLATAMLDQVITTVTGDGPRHREYEEKSLAHEDACQILTAADAGLVKGAGTLRNVADFPAHHRCIYGGSGSRQVEVSLDFAVFDENADDDWTADVIAGHYSMIQPDAHPGDGRSTYCVVTTKQEPIDVTGEDFLTTDAELLVRVPHGQAVPCEEAKKVAAAVWAKLPIS